MATEDALLLDRMFANALSPISNYSQGLMSLAVDRRNRERQLQDIAAQRDFLANESLLQRQFQEKLTREELEARSKDIASQRASVEKIAKEDRDAMDAREKAQSAAIKERILAQIDADYKAKTQAEKDTEKRRMLALARQLGSEVKEDASFDTIAREVVDRQGQKYIQASKKAGAAMAAYKAATGKDASQLKAQQAQVVSALVADQLKPEEVEAIRRNPAQMDSLLAKFATTDKKKYRLLVQAMNDAMTQVLGTETEEAKAAGRTAIAASAADFQSSIQELAELRKGWDFSPEVMEQANRAYAMIAHGINPDTGPATGGATQGGGGAALSPAGAASSAATASGRPLPPPSFRRAAAPAAPVYQRSDIPDLIGTNPYGLLSGLMREEAAAAPPMGGVGQSFGLSQTTPLRDAWLDSLAGTLGLTNQPVGSSSFGRTAGSQLMANPELLKTLDAIPQDQTDKMALQTLGRYWNQLPPNSPARLRLETYIRQNAAKRAAVTPTAFPGAVQLNPNFIQSLISGAAQ